MDIKKHYKYLYDSSNDNTEVESIDIKNYNNSLMDIIFAPYYKEVNGDEKYTEKSKIDERKTYSRECKLIKKEKNQTVSVVVNITSDNEVEIIIETDSDNYYISTIINLDGDLFAQERRYMTNNLNTKILFNMILDKIEQVNSFMNQHNLLVESLKNETDKDIATEKIRVFIDNMLNKSKSIGLKDKDIYMNIFLNNTSDIYTIFVYNLSIDYNFDFNCNCDYDEKEINKNWLRDAYIQEEFGSIKLNVPVIQVFEFQHSYDDIFSIQIILPELDSIVEISKIPITDNATSYKISINDTLFSISDYHVNRDDIFSVKKVYKKIIVNNNILQLEDIPETIITYSKSISTFESGCSTVVNIECNGPELTYKYYERVTGRNISIDDTGKYVMMKTDITDTRLNSSNKLVYKKYDILNIYGYKNNLQIDNEETFFETNDPESNVKSKYIFFSNQFNKINEYENKTLTEILLGFTF